MKRTLKDGTVIEGTPAELAEYDRATAAPYWLEVKMPVVVPTTQLRDATPPCLFDGLKPGFYGIYCPCPRCTPTCSVTS